MGIAPPSDQSRAGHTGGDCPTCKRPLAVAGVAGVTEDTLKFCFGTGSKACLSWTHRNVTAPGEPEPRGLFGWKQSTWASIREVARIAVPVVGLAVAGAAAASSKPATKQPTRRAPKRGGR